MRILKQEKSDRYLMVEIEEDWLIGQFNVSLNYKAYLESLIKLDDVSLLAVVPGKSIKDVREALDLQMKACDDFLLAWKEILDKAKINPNKN
jgi:hypothetical protein